MRIKPTKRKGGWMMCTYREPIHIGLNEIILSMIHEKAVFGRGPDGGRAVQMRLAIDFVVSRGSWSYYDAVDSEMTEQYGTMCAIRAQELFPELAAGVDLSQYGVVR